MGEDTAASPDPSVTREEGQRDTGALSRTRFYPRSHNTPTSIKCLPTAQGPWSGGEVTQPLHPKGLDLTLTPILRRTPTEGERRAQAHPADPQVELGAGPPCACCTAPNPLPGAEQRTADAQGPYRKLHLAAALRFLLCSQPGLALQERPGGPRTPPRHPQALHICSSGSRRSPPHHLNPPGQVAYFPREGGRMPHAWLPDPTSCRRNSQGGQRALSAVSLKRLLEHFLTEEP